jgi:hypothetical protein
MQMKQTNEDFETMPVRCVWRILSAVLVLALPAASFAKEPKRSATAPAPVMEQRALDLLKHMSETLIGAKAFTYRSRSMVEIPAKTGQFITLFAVSEVALERPNKLRANVTGDVPNFQFYYDGASIGASDPQTNQYSVVPSAPATIDEMLEFVKNKAGVNFHSSDVMFSDPYAVMSKGLTSAFVVGRATVEGSPCEHLAFRGPGINWEIWIDAGERALPRRLAATYTAIANFPRFLVEFSDWNLSPTLSQDTFAFKKPANAKEIEFASRLPSSDKAVK